MNEKEERQSPLYSYQKGEAFKLSRFVLLFVVRKPRSNRKKKIIQS